MSKFKLGKLRPEIDKRTLHFGDYITTALAPPPPSANYSGPVTAWPMMGNDQYGDCTCAAAGHMIEEWTANTGTEVTLTDQVILQAYNHFAHGNADAGASMLGVLKYWRKTGIGKDKIAAFAQLEPKNHPQAQDAINLFGNAYIGLALPNFAVPADTNFLDIPWVVPAGGAVGSDAAPNPQNGHCVPAVGYDQRQIYVVTWGALKTMTWQFYDAYADEAYAVLSPDWINQKVGTSPSGFNLAALQQDLQEIVQAQPQAA
jgi:hypothetical protein